MSYFSLKDNTLSLTTESQGESDDRVLITFHFVLQDPDEMSDDMQKLYDVRMKIIIHQKK